jgi:hypothetical protein
LGHSTIHDYFFQSNFFDIILTQWLQDNISEYRDSLFVPISQKVIECLALNRSITLQQLAKKINTEEQDVIKVINNYSLLGDFSSNPYHTTSESYYDVDMQKKTYVEFMARTIIVTKRTNIGVTYELSLFGVMLIISLVRYYHVGIDNIRSTSLSAGTYRADLFYKDITMQEYCDRIARNYEQKLPLIFGKWKFLKTQLGSVLLYDNFDFLIYKKPPSKSMTQSIWLGGNKEFYDDIQSLAFNAGKKLIPTYISGEASLLNYQKYRNIMNDSRITPVYRKLKEIEEILKYADIASFLEELKYGTLPFSNRSRYQDSHTDPVPIIENIFKNELTFFFYINLNTIAFSMNKYYRAFLDKIHFFPEVDKEMFQLGSPRQRLIAVLKKDQDIKQWFSKWIFDIMNYRNQTSDKMSEFYNDIMNPHKHIKQEEAVKKSHNEVVLRLHHDEYDATKIHSDLDDT